MVWGINSLSANPQNGQTHLNNCLSVLDHFVGFVLKGLSLKDEIISTQHTNTCSKSTTEALEQPNSNNNKHTKTMSLASFC